MASIESKPTGDAEELRRVLVTYGNWPQNSCSKGSKVRKQCGGVWRKAVKRKRISHGQVVAGLKQSFNGPEKRPL